MANKNKYIVLGINGTAEKFEKHQRAFNYCEDLQDKIKGVFKLIDESANVIGALNVWTGGEFWDGEQKLKAKHDQFTYKVIQ